MITSTIQALFKIKIQPNMSEKKKETTKNIYYIICLTPKPS